MAVLRLVSVQTEDDSLEDGAPPSRLYPMPVVKGRSFDLLKGHPGRDDGGFHKEDRH